MSRAVVGVKGHLIVGCNGRRLRSHLGSNRSGISPPLLRLIALPLGTSTSSLSLFAFDLPEDPRRV